MKDVVENCVNIMTDPHIKDMWLINEGGMGITII
jgi:hypothetical protein